MICIWFHAHSICWVIVSSEPPNCCLPGSMQLWFDRECGEVYTDGLLQTQAEEEENTHCSDKSNQPFSALLFLLQLGTHEQNLLTESILLEWCSTRGMNNLHWMLARKVLWELLISGDSVLPSKGQQNITEGKSSQHLARPLLKNYSKRMKSDLLRLYHGWYRPPHDSVVNFLDQKT